MRLAEDDRARVPFALVGVILLVGSASYAATLAHRPPPPDRPDAVAAMNRVDGTIATAVHRGTKRAARRAAGAPVVSPADTTGGGVLSRKNTFRDYLELRVYLAVRSDLERARVTVGGARAVPSLRATPNACALRAATRRVTVTRVDGGVRVRIENVTVRLRIGGRVVERRNRTVVRTVATPVLAVHDRVERYERRLNRGPTEGLGLGRRLSARMNAIAWTRGYAQHGGAPIVNVVTNRHLELQANGALLSTQRAVFGRSDPAGRRATTRATAIVGATDVVQGGSAKLDTVDVLSDRPGVPSRGPGPGLSAPTRPPTAADGNVTVGVDLSADEAFTAVVSGDGDTTLDAVVGSVYGAEVRLVGASRAIASSTGPAARPDGQNWTLVDERTTRSVAASPTELEGPTPRIEGDWHRLASYTRRVVVTKRIEKRWSRDSGDLRETRTTTRTVTRTEIVTVAIAGRHARSAYAPARGIGRVHARGGPLDGPNLRYVTAAARQRVRERVGGPSELAGRYATDDLPEEPIEIAAKRPSGLRDWLVDDLAGLRERVRNVSLTVRRTRLGAGEVNPAAVLAERLRSRRGSLVDAPATYGSVAEKARVAVRGAYLAVVVDRLERRARATRDTRSAFDETLARYGLDAETLSAGLDAGARTEPPPAHPLATGGPLGSLNATVAGTPPYLTLSGVTHGRYPSVPAGDRYHPLVARNTNVFTVPHGEAADGVVAAVLGEEDRTSLATAATTLRSSNRALDRRHDPELAQRRDELRSSVRRSLDYLREQLVLALVRTEGLDGRVARAAVRAGLDRWDAPATRALAATNGSLAAAVAGAVARRAGPDVHRRPLVTANLRVVLAHARSKRAARPRQAVVNRSATLTRRLTKRVVATATAELASRAAQRVTRKLGGKLAYPPAGLPIAPVPGYWYVTTNVWSIDVRGEYLRFAVSVPTGTPGRNLTYVRERSVVAVDWDDDGRAERLGRTTRVSFEQSVGVLVVVPPGPPGVGDRDGNADERSAGWPSPGNATAE